jgi:flavin-dependent dehydrogenase
VDTDGVQKWDVIVIGGGPAGSILASLLARAGRSVLVVERDIHPRDHVGESLTPSSNYVFERIGFRDKMEAAGFVHKPGAAWTAPRSPVGTFLSIRLDEVPLPDMDPHHTYNVERHLLDAMLLRHAHEQGAKVLQGVRVERVLMQDERAVGVRARVVDGWTTDLFARFVVDASGRRCVIASQLGLRRSDPDFNQFGMYSWFRDVAPPPAGTEGMIFLHFLGLERAWAWQIPLQNDIWSVGFVTDRRDFKKAGVDADQYIDGLVSRNATLSHNLRHARRVRPWMTEADYSYKVDRLTGPGWLLLGDAMRFVDPIFSTGFDVASFSALHASNAIETVLTGGAEEVARAEYEQRIGSGIDAWYQIISLFYRSQNLFTYYASRKETRKDVVRILQGNLYEPATQQRARDMIDRMERSFARVATDPSNLLRAGALEPVS